MFVPRDSYGGGGREACEWEGGIVVTRRESGRLGPKCIVGSFFVAVGQRVHRGGHCVLEADRLR
jgi:hypothetical protein